MEWNPNPSAYPAYLRSRVTRGFGIGVGAQYQPWLRVRDVPSRGTSAIVAGIRVARRHHLLSTQEAIYFYLIERKPSVIDSREQFPILDIPKTLQIAAERGLRHPYDGAFPRPLTIDFLLTIKSSAGIEYQAKSIKTPEDAADPAVRAQLSLEKQWCETQGIHWALIDTLEFTDDVLRTLRFIRGWFRHRYEPSADRADRFAEAFLRRYERNVPLKQLVKSVASGLRTPFETAQNHFRFCCWSDRVPVDLRTLVALDEPLVLKAG